MMAKSTIVSVTARQIMSERDHAGVEAMVITENGSKGDAIGTAGVSIETHEIPFAYNGGEKWRGKGVMRAVNAVTEKNRSVDQRHGHHVANRGG